MSAKGTTNILDQSCSPAYCTTKSSLLEGGPGCNKKINSPQENVDWLRRNDTFGRDHVPIPNQEVENVMNITQANNSQTFPAENPCRRKLTNKQIEAKRVRERVQHASMTPE